MERAARHDDPIERLMMEFNLHQRAQRVTEVTGWPTTVDPDRANLDDRQRRILDRSMRWIGFLQDQAQQLTTAATTLFDRLLATAACQSAEFGAGPSKDEVIDRLEWTLAAVECWIEEQQPSDGRARFRVRWTADDGLGSWVAGDEEYSEPTSLRAVVQDAAETEGGFSDLSAEIAALVVAGLRSDDVKLLRLRRIAGESSVESVYEMAARGEAYRELAEAREEERAMVAPEVEAALDEGLPLAAFLDSASYAASAVGIEASSSRDRSRDAALGDGIAEVARRCHVPRRDIVRSLLSLVNHQIEAAALAGDHEAVLRLGRTIKSLASIVLRE